MTKPQALPLIVPFLAWYLATGGLRGLSRWVVVVATTGLILWIPFVLDDGPAQYLRNVAGKQNGEFGVLSFGAWNPWWLIQEVAGGGGPVSDQIAIIGPITARTIGLAITGVLALIVSRCVYRAPTQRTMALALAAMSLLTFCFLTTMHERYAYGAVVFLAFVLAERRVMLLWVLFGIIFTFNAFYAIPPPDLQYLAILGSVAMTALAVYLLSLLVDERRLAPGPTS